MASLTPLAQHCDDCPNEGYCTSAQLGGQGHNQACNKCLQAKQDCTRNGQILPAVTGVRKQAVKQADDRLRSQWKKTSRQPPPVPQQQQQQQQPQVSQQSASTAGAIAPPKTATLQVPASKMGYVLGAQGANRRSMERQYGVTAVPGQSSLTIAGPAAGVDAAATAFRATLNRAPYEQTCAQVRQDKTTPSACLVLV